MSNPDTPAPAADRLAEELIQSAVSEARGMLAAVSASTATNECAWCGEDVIAPPKSPPLCFLCEREHLIARALLDARARLAERDREVAARIIRMIDAHGKPGPGGVNITNGIPSEIYIGIGRERYEDEGGDYELAEDTANSVRRGLIEWIAREFEVSIDAALARPALAERAGSATAPTPAQERR